MKWGGRPGQLRSGASPPSQLSRVTACTAVVAAGGGCGAALLGWAMEGWMDEGDRCRCCCWCTGWVSVGASPPTSSLFHLLSLPLSVS